MPCKIDLKNYVPSSQVERDIQILSFAIAAISWRLGSSFGWRWRISQLVLHGWALFPNKVDTKDMEARFDRLNAFWYNPLHARSRVLFSRSLRKLSEDERDQLTVAIAKKGIKEFQRYEEIYQVKPLRQTERSQRDLPNTVALKRIWGAAKNGLWYVYRQASWLTNFSSGFRPVSGNYSMVDLVLIISHLTQIWDTAQKGWESLVSNLYYRGFSVWEAKATLCSSAIGAALFLKWIGRFAPAPARIRNGKNLTQKYREKPWEAPIGRKAEIKHLADNIDLHPILLGNPGVGKTEIVKGLAAAIEKGELPHLKGKQVYYLSATEILLNNDYIVDQARVSALEILKRELEGHEDQAILCIDEVHMLAKELQGEKNPMIEAFTTFLDETKAHVVCLTTQEDFKEHISSLETWTSRMEQIPVKPLDTTNSRLVIQRYAQKHPLLNLTDEAIDKLLLETENPSEIGAAQTRRLITLTRKTLHVATTQLRKNPAFVAMESIQKLKSTPLRRRALTLLAKQVNPNVSTEHVVQASAKLEQSSPLEKYGARNLTRLAQLGKLKPMVGREKEVKQLLCVLNAFEKNNAVLVGKAGTGKTRIAEGIAQLIVEGNVPEALKDRQLIAIDVASLTAGTKYRGTFSSRVRELIRSAKKLNAILFIDEFHTIWRAGAAEGGSLDLANMLKPSLANGELTMIGATTPEEFPIIEQDLALKRRFVKIVIEEPNPDETIAILKKIKGKYEAHHKVTYSDAVIKKIVSEAKQLEGAFPDTAVKLLDLAGSACAADRRKKVSTKDVTYALKVINPTGTKLSYYF